MNLSAKNLIKILELNGFIYKRTNGSHHIFFDAITNKTVAVPIYGKKRYQKELSLRFLDTWDR